MQGDGIRLYDLINPRESDGVLTEILEIFGRCGFMNGEAEAMARVHGDIVDLFHGDFPGYRACNAKYHNLEHTCSVALATARLLHGCLVSGFAPIGGRDFLLGMIAAYFHDTGLIQEEGDDRGTGAKYTIGHEQRSIAFMIEYLSARNYPKGDVKVCTDAIRSTNLNLPPSKVEYGSLMAEMGGRIVGSADLLAQIADRTYLEKLRLLFAEFSEARLPGFDTELDLLKQTEDFYTKMAKKRLNEDFGSIHRHMKAHFSERWDLDRDLYALAIEANITYIRTLVDVCKDDFDCYMENLRRAVH